MRRIFLSPSQKCDKKELTLESKYNNAEFKQSIAWKISDYFWIFGEKMSSKFSIIGLLT